MIYIPPQVKEIDIISSQQLLGASTQTFSLGNEGFSTGSSVDFD